MNLPSRWVRRVMLAPAMVLLTIMVLTTLPLWMLLAAALSPFDLGNQLSSNRTQGVPNMITLVQAHAARLGESASS